MSKLPPRPYLKWARTIANGSPCGTALVLALTEFSPKQLIQDEGGVFYAVRSLEWWSDYTGFNTQRVRKTFSELEEFGLIQKKIKKCPYSKKTAVWIRFKGGIFDLLVKNNEFESGQIRPDQSGQIRPLESGQIRPLLYIIVSTDTGNRDIKNKILKKARMKSLTRNRVIEVVGIINEIQKEKGRKVTEEDIQSYFPLDKREGEKPPYPPLPDFKKMNVRSLEGKNEMGKNGRGEKSHDILKKKTPASFDQVISSAKQNSENLDFKFNSVKSFTFLWDKLYHAHGFAPEWAAQWTGKELGFAKHLLSVLYRASGGDTAKAANLIDELFRRWDDVQDYAEEVFNLDDSDADPSVGYLVSNKQGKKVIQYLLRYLREPDLCWAELEKKQGIQ